MLEVRCGRCRKLLGRATGELEIKCPRCGCMNHWRASAADRSGQSPKPERRERPNAMSYDDAIIEKPFGMAGRQEPPG
ncbi:Com family DNA-binding transcriptional regulator [Ottowia oryzae]